MSRLLSVLVALAATGAGVWLVSVGGARVVMAYLRAYATDPGAWLPFTLMAVAGAVMLGVAAFTVRWSRLGVIVAGSAHVLFALVFILYPSDMRTFSMSPAIVFLNGLHGTDSALATGASFFVGYGVSILVGCALVAVGLGAPARRGQSSTAVAVLSAAGGVLAIGAALWAIVAAGPFYRATLQIGRWEALAAAALVVAALVFGALLLPSGRSPAGTWVAGGAISLAGLALLIPFPGAPSMLPLQIGQQLLTIGWSGMILALGLTLLGLALGVSLRRRTVPPVPAPGAWGEAVVPPPGATAPGGV